MFISSEEEGKQLRNFIKKRAFVIPIKFVLNFANVPHPVAKRTLPNLVLQISRDCIILFPIYFSNNYFLTINILLLIYSPSVLWRFYRVVASSSSSSLSLVSAIHIFIYWRTYYLLHQYCMSFNFVAHQRSIN